MLAGATKVHTMGTHPEAHLALSLTGRWQFREPLLKFHPALSQFRKEGSPQEQAVSADRGTERQELSGGVGVAHHDTDPKVPL